MYTFRVTDEMGRWCNFHTDHLTKKQAFERVRSVFCEGVKSIVLTNPKVRKRRKYVYVIKSLTREIDQIFSTLSKARKYLRDTQKWQTRDCDSFIDPRISKFEIDAP